MEYPKWITRAPGIGPVLVQNGKEEQELTDAWEAEQLEKAEAEAEAAKKLASEAKEEAQVTLKGKGK